MQRFLKGAMLSTRELLIKAIRERKDIVVIEDLLSEYSLERYTAGWDDGHDSIWADWEEEEKDK